MKLLSNFEGCDTYLRFKQHLREIMENCTEFNG